MHFFAGVTRENAKGEAVLDAINGIPVTLHPPSPTEEKYVNNEFTQKDEKILDAKNLIS